MGKENVKENQSQLCKDGKSTGITLHKELWSPATWLMTPYVLRATDQCVGLWNSNSWPKGPTDMLNALSSLCRCSAKGPKPFTHIIYIWTHKHKVSISPFKSNHLFQLHVQFFNSSSLSLTHTHTRQVAIYCGAGSIALFHVVLTYI